MLSRIVCDRRDQTEHQRLACGERLRQQEHLQRSRFADKARQALRTAPSGHDAERCPAMPEDRGSGGDAQIACERQIESAAHAVAFDGSDDRRGVSIDCLHQPLPCRGERERVSGLQRADLLQIGARRKEACVTAQHDRFCRNLCRKSSEQPGERLDLHSRQPVHSVRRLQVDAVMILYAFEEILSRRHHALAILAEHSANAMLVVNSAK